MIVNVLPQKFASVGGVYTEGVGVSFDVMWERFEDALLAMQDATGKYAEEHTSLTDIPRGAAAIMLCIVATIIILLTAIAALFALAVGVVIVLYALFALA